MSTYHIRRHPSSFLALRVAVFFLWKASLFTCTCRLISDLFHHTIRAMLQPCVPCAGTRGVQSMRRASSQPARKLYIPSNRGDNKMCCQATHRYIPRCIACLFTSLERSPRRQKRRSGRRRRTFRQLGTSCDQHQDRTARSDSDNASSRATRPTEVPATIPGRVETTTMLAAMHTCTQSGRRVGEPT